MGAPKRQQNQQDSSQSAAGLGFGVRVVSDDRSRAREIASELEQAVSRWFRIEAGIGRAEGKQVLFVDGESDGLSESLEGVDRNETGVYLVVDEDSDVPVPLIEGLVDDVIVRPFRALEVLSKLRHYQGLLDSREGHALHARYAELAERFQGDLELAKKLQKSKLPIRFPGVKGFKITSRYLAGARSGGDYVDLAESRDGGQVAIVLTDASSYRLSSSVLDTLPRVMGGLSLEEVRSSVTTARRIRDGILSSLSEQDRLSLFYGTLSRKDYRLRYVNLGSSRAFYAAPGKPFLELETQGDAIQRATGVRAEREGEVSLEGGGRFAVFSDGFVEAAGGVDALRTLLDRFRASDAKDALNELVYQVKSALHDAEDLPPQDCTGAIFDVDSRLIRLA